MHEMGDSTLSLPQRHAMIATMNDHRQAIRTLTDLNKAALQLVANSKSVSADNVRSTYTALNTEELIETNQKQVNGIYLATIGMDVDTFTVDQATTLFAIAEQCPMIGGNAVFKARSLYYLIDELRSFDDPQLCLPHGIVVKRAEEPQPNGVTVVPNPASDQATLVLSHELDVAAVFVIRNAMGAVVMRHPIPAHTTQLPFSTQALAPAMYHYQVLSAKGVVGDGKLNIVH